MKRTVLAALLFILPVFFLLSQVCRTDRLSYCASIYESGFTERLNPRIDSFMQSYMDRGVLPNFIAMVVRNGNVAAFNVKGLSDIEHNIPLRKDDIFRLASMTKPIVSVGLMQLYEQGRFRLDDPVKKYLPEFSDPKVLVSVNMKDTSYTTRPAKSDITIRQLLSHSAGIGYGFISNDTIAALFAKAGVGLLSDERGTTTEENIKRIASVPLLFDPGSGFHYSAATDVCGRLIEVLSQKRVDKYLSDNVLLPLGMKDTYFIVPQEKRDRVVQPCSKLKDKPLIPFLMPAMLGRYDESVTLFSGGAGLLGTIEDYAKFCQMMVNEGTFNDVSILKKETIETMLQNQVGKHAHSVHGWGLGFELMLDDKEFPNGYGWSGLYKTIFYIDPVNRLSVIMFSNVYPIEGESGIHTKLRRIVYEEMTDRK